MPNLVQSLNSLDPGAAVEMFVLDLSSIPGASGIQRFHDGVNIKGQDLVWRGETYTRFPIKASGFDKQVKGPLPRPRLLVENVTGTIVPLLLAYQDLVKATVIRKRTLARFLDAVNFPDGNPDADPTQAHPDDVYYIERKISESPESVEFELVSAMDLSSFKLPGEIISTDICPHEYRQWRNGAFDMVNCEACNYTGARYFDAQNQPTTDPSRDVCAKSVDACGLRFAGQPLRFGGFKGARKYRA
jgi:lambda family phage minor tail protein L